MSDCKKCPYSSSSSTATGSAVRVGGNTKGYKNSDWWPDQLNLNILRQQHYDHDDDHENYKQYAKEFLSLDIGMLKEDIMKCMVTSQDWWPADYGHYGPLFIRLAWHSAGTYRTFDGRGGGNTGNIRLAPLNSWPDNGNLDKARRLLWPIKQKYGRKISWADLFIFVGNCAMESMGCPPLGFAGGRMDIMHPEEDIDWGPEQTWLADTRHNNTTGGGCNTNRSSTGLDTPLGAVQMGLIYVNPEGPGGVPDIMGAARDIRETFGRMAMNDEETVALIAGGHTFGKAHGAADPSKFVGREPEGAAIEQQGLGWNNTYQSGKGNDTITSGLEGAWTTNPIQWDHGYFDALFGYEWEPTKSPGGAIQWIPTNPSARGTVPNAHGGNNKNNTIIINRHQHQTPIMFTTDLALKVDPKYHVIAKKFHLHPQQFQRAFVKAWFKLTHRDMGPRSRYLGRLVPMETFLWQDPIPDATYPIIDHRDIDTLKQMIRSSGLSVSQLVSTAWASACTYRKTDHRGGANGGRIRLAPQKDWLVNSPKQLQHVLQTLQTIQQQFNHNNNNKKTQVSMADLIVLGGCTAIEQAIQKRSSTHNHRTNKNTHVPFTPGRTDASIHQTDVSSFAVLEPHMDGFRNYFGEPNQWTTTTKQSPEESLIDRAYMLTLSVREMTVLLAGLRVLNIVHSDSQNTTTATSAARSLGVGVFTMHPETLSNDFFIHLLDTNIQWNKQQTTNKYNHNDHKCIIYEGRDSSTGKLQWVGSQIDLLFGSHSELRAIAEIYACNDANEQFIQDFISVWTKVMNLDRFDAILSKKQLHSPKQLFSKL